MVGIAVLGVIVFLAVPVFNAYLVEGFQGEKGGKLEPVTNANQAYANLFSTYIQDEKPFSNRVGAGIQKTPVRPSLTISRRVTIS
jgi:hypothetical protein